MSRTCRTHLPLVASGLIFASGLLLSSPARAQDATCPSTECAAIPSPCSLGTPPPTKKIVTYFEQANVSACNSDGTCNDPRASCESGRCNIRLKGELFKPSGPGPFPAVVLNHGSVSFGNHDPQPYYDAVKRFFWSKGFVVLVPSRRGYVPSTGIYIDDLLTRQYAGGFPCTIGGHCQTFDLQQEGQDVAAALRWLHGRNYVKPERIALLGHSLGGIVTLFTGPFQNVFPLFQVNIAIAPGSESWCGDLDLQGALLTAADNAFVPTYVFEPLNDVNIRPTIELGHELGLTFHVYESQLFPQVKERLPDPDNPGHLKPEPETLTCGVDAHVCFAMDPTYVSKWGPSVIQFMARYGVK